MTTKHDNLLKRHDIFSCKHKDTLKSTEISESDEQFCLLIVRIEQLSKHKLRQCLRHVIYKVYGQNSKIEMCLITVIQYANIWTLPH